MKLLQKEIDTLENGLLALAADVEAGLRKAVRAVETLDRTLCDEVIAGDALIDEAEVALEEECLKILALYQPVAIDLRKIVAVLKINNDLERIGDYSVSIAKRCDTLTRMPDAKAYHNPRFPQLVNAVTGLLQRAIDSFVRMDLALARRVRLEEAEADTLRRVISNEMTEIVRKNTQAGIVEVALEHLRVVRSLERIADHAVNIAEDVIYMIDGTVVRHKEEA